MQSYVIDSDLTQVPVSRLSTFRKELSLAVKLTLQVNEMDVSTAFINDVLNDFVYVKPPPGYEHLVPRGKSLMLI